MRFDAGWAFWLAKSFLGKSLCFGEFLGSFWGSADSQERRFRFEEKDLQREVLKRKISKCKDICRTYSSTEETYVDILEKDESVQEIRRHVLLDGLLEGEYTSDFVCIQIDGEIIVRECVQRGHCPVP